MTLTLSLATELFPGLNETTPTAFGSHAILHAQKGLLRWAEASADTCVDVLALHVGIADPIDAAGFAALRRAFPRAGLLTNFGVGLNHLDLDAARAQRFRVTNTPDVLTDATADTALLLLLLTTRQAAEAWQDLREHGRYEGWKPVARFMGTGLVGKALGLVGYGRIARALAQRAESLGMHVLVMESARRGDAHQRLTGERLTGEEARQTHAVVRLPEAEFLAACDVVSLHFPLAPETRGWLDSRRLSLMKPGAYLINTARGEVVDEEALASVLRSGRLAGAGLDVFQGEPVLSSVLRSAPRCIVLPHIGSATFETRRAMGALNRAALEAALAPLLPE